MEQTTKQTYKEMCMLCGTALMQHEIGAQITGQTVDFEERIAVQGTNYFLCSECSERIKVFMTGGMKKAIERRELLKERMAELDLTGHDPIILGS